METIATDTASRVYARLARALAAGDGHAVAMCFTQNATLVVNGRRCGEIPFAGKYSGHAAIADLIHSMVLAVEDVEVTSRPPLVGIDQVSGQHQMVCPANLRATVAATGTVFDVEVALMLTLEDDLIASCRVFGDTDLVRRAFSQRSPEVLSDEKSAHGVTINRGPDLGLAAVVPEIYRLMFDTLDPVKDRVGAATLFAAAVRYVVSHPRWTPRQWWRIMTTLNSVDMMKRTVLLDRYYSDDLTHQIKGGETDIALCGTYHGKQGLAEFGTRLFTELDYAGVPPILSLLVDGDHCAVHMPESFVNRSTGIAAVVHMLHLWRITPDGKVIEFTSYNDTYEIVHSYTGSSNAGDSPSVRQPPPSANGSAMAPLFPTSPLRRAATALLFRDAPATPRPAVTEMPTRSVFILVKRAAGMSRRAFFGQLAGATHAQILASPTLNAVEYHQYHDASCNGIATLPYMFTRSYRFTRTLCRLRGEPEPDPHTMPYRPYYDAMIEFVFAERPNSEQLDDLRKIIAALQPISARLSTVESAFRRKLVRSAVTSDAVYLAEFLVSPPGATREQTQQYWISPHGEFIIDHRRDVDMAEYQQVHAVPSGDVQLDADEYDGFAWVRFPNARRFTLSTSKLTTLRFNNELVLDETRFVGPVKGLLLREHPVTCGPITGARRAPGKGRPCLN